MQRVSSLGLMAATVLTGLALMSAGCSSTEPPPGGDSQGGNSGHSGSGGAAGAGADAGESCQSLIADYAAAFQTARSCSPFLDNVQCTQLAGDSLLCGSCRVHHVNDTTQLDAIRAAYFARTDCGPRPLCPAILCIDPGTSGACEANDSGSAGSCVDVR